MTEDLKTELAVIKERHHTNGDSELGRVCQFDHYPTPLDCHTSANEARTLSGCGPRRRTPRMAQGM